jgi:hypothetical protein
MGKTKRWEKRKKTKRRPCASLVSNMRHKPVVLYGVPIPMALVSIYDTMQPFIAWFQRATAGYLPRDFLPPKFLSLSRAFPLQRPQHVLQRHGVQEDANRAVISSVV